MNAMCDVKKNQFYTQLYSVS